MVAHQVGGDMGQPGVHPAVAAERVPSVVGLQQAILHDGLGHVLIAKGISDKPQQAGPVHPVQRRNVIQLGKRGLTRHAADDIGIESKLHIAL